MSKTVYPTRFSALRRMFVMAILLMLPAAGVFAQGDLLISPLRIVFEGNKKSQEISLANVGKDTATYVISVKDIRMNENGSFEEITVPDSGQNFAGPYMRFFPRKVTLAPNEAQVVKVQLIKTTQMAPGEYRSHLYFRSVPDERPLGERPAKKDTGGISIQLTPIFGITIPVIIRVGDYNAGVTLANPTFEMPASDTARLTVTFARSGTMSVYGDLKVEHVTSGGKTTVVKQVKGIGVYTPKNIRRFSVDLDTEKKVDYHKGKLHITYTMQIADKETKDVETDLELK